MLTNQLLLELIIITREIQKHVAQKHSQTTIYVMKWKKPTAAEERRNELVGWGIGELGKRVGLKTKLINYIEFRRIKSKVKSESVSKN